MTDSICRSEGPGGDGKIRACTTCGFPWGAHPQYKCWCLTPENERLRFGFMWLFVFVPHPEWADCGGAGVVVAESFPRACKLLIEKDRLTCGDPSKLMIFQETPRELKENEDHVDLWVQKAKIPIYMGDKTEKVVTLNYHWS